MRELQAEPRVRHGDRCATPHWLSPETAPPAEQAGRPSRRRASTRTATPAEAGAGLNESTAAQLLVDGVQARARRRAKTGDPRADRAAADAVIEADPAEYAERVAAAQIAAAQAARDAG